MKKLLLIIYAVAMFNIGVVGGAFICSGLNKLDDIRKMISK